MKKERKCKYCGNRKANTGRFCSRCGKPLYGQNKIKRNGGIAVVLVLLLAIVVMVVVSIRAKNEYTPAGDHIFEGDDINAKADETTDVTNEEKKFVDESQEAEEDEVDVMNYLTDYESLESVLNTKDFTTYSPAELLMRIGNAYAAARKDFTNMMREYSYNHGDLTDLHL